MRSTVVSIEGVDMLVDVYSDTDTTVRADFCSAADHADYMAAGRIGASPWERMIGWRNPIAALRQIGAVVIALADGQPIWLEGCDMKRTRVYEKLLTRSGIRCARKIDAFGDECILIGE